MKRLIPAFLDSTWKSILLLILSALILRLILLQFSSSSSGIASIDERLNEVRGHWWAFLEIGFYRDAVWSDLLRKLGNTCLMVFLGLCWSTALAFLLGYQLAKKPHSILWDWLAGITAFASGLPFFVMGLIAYTLLSRYSDFSSLYFKLALGGLILGSFEGALGELPRNLRTLLTQLQDSTYYFAYKANGRSTAGIVYRTVRPYLLQSLSTRVSYLLGGAIIVEKAIGANQIGTYFLETAFGKTDNGYCFAMISGLLIMSVPILVRLVTRTYARFLNTGAWQTEAIFGSNAE